MKSFRGTHGAVSSTEWAGNARVWLWTRSSPNLFTSLRHPINPLHLCPNMPKLKLEPVLSHMMASAVRREEEEEDKDGETSKGEYDLLFHHALEHGCHWITNKTRRQFVFIPLFHLVSLSLLLLILLLFWSSLSFLLSPFVQQIDWMSSKSCSSAAKDSSNSFIHSAL